MLHPVNFSLKGVVLNEIPGCDEYVIRKLDRFPQRLRLRKIGRESSQNIFFCKMNGRKTEHSNRERFGKGHEFLKLNVMILKESKKAFVGGFNYF